MLTHLANHALLRQGGFAWDPLGSTACLQELAWQPPGQNSTWFTEGRSAGSGHVEMV